jgi:hypothetical protein
VGLEDNNKMPDGSLATNLKLVQYVAELAQLMGRPLATPDEARQILNLKPEWKDRILPQLGLTKEDVYGKNNNNSSESDDEKKTVE